jgi:peptidoglycan/LPS O-acetylase OafA/YrhL
MFKRQSYNKSNLNKIFFVEYLRVVAVFSVILYHYYPKQFSQGYLGVDVFLVVSGFVITSSLLKVKTFDFSELVNFYKRRMLRLLPALYLVLITVLIISLVIDPPHITKDISQAVFATILYFANIFYYTEIDYFHTFQSQSPLLHTWSLSLEEQFYFVLPLIFLMCVSKSRRVTIILILTLLSFATYLFEDDYLMKHYMPQNRFWQLFLGVIVAFMPKIKITKLLHLFLAFLIIVVLIYPLGVVNLNQYLVTCFTCIFLLSENNHPIYNVKPVVFLGGLSYSMYLIHQPVFYYSGHFLNNSLVNFTLLTFVVIGFSYLSYCLVEKRLRYSNSPTLIYGIGIISFILIVSAYSVHSTRGLFEWKKSLYRLDGIHTENLDYDQILQKRIQYSDSVLSLELTDSTILIFGDSKGEDLLSALCASTGERFSYIRRHANDYSTPISAEERSKIEQAQVVFFTNTWTRKGIEYAANFIGDMSSEKLVYVLSTANYKDVSSQYFTYSRRGLKIEEMNDLMIKSIRYDWQRQSTELHDALLNEGIHWLNKESFFDHKGFFENGKIIVYDTGHLSREGYKPFGEWILNETGLLP